MLVQPRTLRALRWVQRILAAEVLVVLLMTLTLFFFSWRARAGYYWGYQRLRLFSRIFPVISLNVATILGLYPYWMVIEQIIFAILMIGIADFLSSDHMHDAYPSPRRRAEPAGADESAAG